MHAPTQTHTHTRAHAHTHTAQIQLTLTYKAALKERKGKNGISHWILTSCQPHRVTSRRREGGRVRRGGERERVLSATSESHKHPFHFWPHHNSPPPHPHPIFHHTLPNQPTSSASNHQLTYNLLLRFLFPRSRCSWR